MINCPKCKIDKPVVDFDQHLNRVKGSQGWCRMCREYHYGSYDFSQTIESEPVKNLFKTMRDIEWKKFHDRMEKLFSDPRATDTQHWRSDEPPVTEQELARARATIDEVTLDRIEMDRNYVQEQDAFGVYDFEPYTDAQRSTPARPHKPKPGGLAEKVHRSIANARSKHKDPQAERAFLMKKHGVDWFEAIKRWPLTDYGKWK